MIGTQDPVLNSAAAGLAGTSVLTGLAPMARQWYGFASRKTHLSDGVNDAWWLSTRSLGRENSQESPYLIANEWICGNIANFLRLPIPPFALMRKNRARKGIFASLGFDATDVPPDDVRPDECVRNLPDLCSGVLLFDILVANSDRHSGNIKVDDPFNPKQMYIFDHDKAMFGAKKRQAVKRLHRLLDQLGVLAASSSRGTRHCFLDVIDTAHWFGKWQERIGQIPKWFIEDICTPEKAVSISAERSRAAVQFLEHRKLRLADIVKANRHEFPRVSDWGML